MRGTNAATGVGRTAKRALGLEDPLGFNVDEKSIEARAWGFLCCCGSFEL